jgi:sialidase-1
MSSRSLFRGLLLCACLPAFAAPEPSQVEVFRSGEDGYHTYRIPALIVSKKGTLLAFCEGRKNGAGDAGNIDLLLKRSFDNRRTWSAAQLIADFGEDTIGNPAPVVDRGTSAIVLLLTRNPGDVVEKLIQAGLSGHTRTVWVARSADDGHLDEARGHHRRRQAPEWTWYATGPGNGIQLRDGRVVVPCDHNRAESNVRHSHVIVSDDGGKTWKLGGSAGRRPTVGGGGAARPVAHAQHAQLPRPEPARRRVSKDRGKLVGIEARRGWSSRSARPADPLRQEPAAVLESSRPEASPHDRQDEPRRGGAWSVARLVRGPSAYSSLAELKAAEWGYERGEKRPTSGSLSRSSRSSEAGLRHRVRAF